MERIIAEYEGEELVQRPATAEELAEIEAREAEATAAIATAELEHKNAGVLRERVGVMLEELKADHAGWAGLTAAQKDRATRNTIRLVLALARLVIRRLEAVE